jgi:hypothetical protein
MMGRKPEELLIRVLERRAEEISGDFNSQNVANAMLVGVCDDGDKNRVHG